MNDLQEIVVEPMPELAGVFAPVTTPFDGVTGELDVVAMRRNARRLAATDLAGVVLFGSTGEGPLLEERERRNALVAVREVVEGKILIAGVAAESTRAAIRLSKVAAAEGAAAVLVAPPSYYLPQLTSATLREHYRAVADAAPVPVLLYQVPPAYSGADLDAGLVAELASHGNVIGIKDSTGDLRAMGGFVETCPAGFAVLAGSGVVFYGALEVGACGGVLAIANLAPRECAELYRLTREGRGTDAGRLQQRLAPLHRAVVGAFGVPGVKAALDLLADAGGSPRPPLRPLRSRDRAAVRTALLEAGLLEGLSQRRKAAEEQQPLLPGPKGTA